MGHIFISYSHKDKEYVEKLAQKLIYEGFKVWIDHRIDYGSAWTNEIEQAINTCDAFIVAMSESSSQSAWVQREVIHAEKRKKPFFPLLLSGEAWFSLGNIQHVDVTDGSLPPKPYYRHLATVAERKGWAAPVRKPVDVKKAHLKKAPHRKKNTTSLKMVYILVGIALIATIIFSTQFLPFSSTPLETATQTLSVTNNSSLTYTPDIIVTEKPPTILTPIPSATQTLTPTFSATQTIIATETKIPTETHATIHPSLPADVSTWNRPIDGIVMSYIPAGEFEMGTEYGAYKDDDVHLVYLDAFWIDRTEVTNAMYAQCVRSDSCVLPTNINNFNNSVYVAHPVVYVSWEDAKAYCEWAGARLPTEAEWEKAARGRDSLWEENIDCNRANYSVCTPNDATTVGIYENVHSLYGLYDMAGNVWEWTEDWYGADYYTNSPYVNPSNSKVSDGRVIRGGSWGDDLYALSVAYREKAVPNYSNEFIGFRCARSATP